MARFREVLSERNFFLLWVGQIISQFGDRLNQMALIAIVYSRAPGSPFELAKFFSFTIIPSFFVSPIAGAFIDRWDRKRTMIGCDILRGLIVLVIPVAFLGLTPTFPIYTAVFLIFAVSCFFLPARLAIIPDLVSKEKLLVANSLFTVTSMIGAIFWFVIGGLLVEFLKVKGGLYLNSFVYLMSAAAIVFITGHRRQQKKAEGSVDIEKIIETSIVREIKDGAKYLAAHSEARFAFRMLFVLMAGAGAAYAVVIVFIQDAMGSMTRDLSLLGFFLGAGFFIGSVAYGKLGHRFSKAKSIFACLILCGISICAFTAVLKGTRSFLGASVVAMILGIAMAPIGISTNTLIHEMVDEKMRGRIFSSLGIAMNLAFLIFMLGAAKLAERVDSGWILYGVSVFYVISGILGFIDLRLFKEKGTDA
ncbi:MAG: MFS transporter [Candidatus Omnitrophica bacterium]|nr:MFS transporter [Candidatus Omnitrophota bacterium]MDD5311100.1 MFS transporter [Candidatus Omnitrophota bacterium]MDD5546424.1 MFS transporter [Candidatus Omnitrophota bacterium]